MELVLDTNIYCDYAKGLREAVDVIATQGEFIFLPSIVIGELTYGFIKGSKTQYNEKMLRRFISRLKVGIIYGDEEVARKYANIYLSLIREGSKIPINDVWITACCMEIGGSPLTRDKHFEKICSACLPRFIT